MSKKASKAVVQRQEGAVVSASNPCISKRPPKTALDEDEFTDALTTIVRRDFFPDVPKLEAQLEFIEASETNDYERLRAISERFPTVQRTPQPAAATPATFETPLSGRTTAGKHPHPHQAAGCSTDSMATDGAPDPKKKPEDYSLDRFLAKYESEDDASFAEIMVKTKEEHRAKHAWLYEKEKEYMQSVEAPEQLLAITDGSEDGGRDKKLPERSGVKSWTYTVKNTLMYIPDGLERSTLEKVSDPSKKREVVHSNTRLSSAFVHKMHSALKGTGEGEAKGSKDKVGIDGKVLDPSSSPQVNGYGFVATPQIQPGVDASPLMTWGSIEGTPVHLETDITPGHGPTFKIPHIPRREEIAHRLADKATKSTRDRKKAAAWATSPALLRKRLGTPGTPSERLQLLSPAARKLASRAATPGSTRRVDKALRQSYTPQRTPASSSTPLGQGSSGSTPRLRTSEGSTTPSLTDNLLNLKNR